MLGISDARKIREQYFHLSENKRKRFGEARVGLAARNVWKLPKRFPLNSVSGQLNSQYPITQLARETRWTRDEVVIYELQCATWRDNRAKLFVHHLACRIAIPRLILQLLVYARLIVNEVEATLFRLVCLSDATEHR